EGATLALMRRSPTSSVAGCRDAVRWADSSTGSTGAPPQAASRHSASVAASARSLADPSVIGGGQFGAAARGRLDRTADQRPETTGLEGLDRRLGGAVGRGNAPAQFGRRLARTG